MNWWSWGGWIAIGFVIAYFLSLGVRVWRNNPTPTAPEPHPVTQTRYRIMRGPMGGHIRLWIEQKLLPDGSWVPQPIVGERTGSFLPDYDSVAPDGHQEARLRRIIAEWVEAETAVSTVVYETPEPTPPPQPTAIDEMPPRPRGIVVPKR